MALLEAWDTNRDKYSERNPNTGNTFPSNKLRSFWARDLPAASNAIAPQLPSFSAGHDLNSHPAGRFRKKAESDCGEGKAVKGKEIGFNGAMLRIEGSWKFCQ